MCDVAHHRARAIEGTQRANVVETREPVRRRLTLFSIDGEASLETSTERILVQSPSRKQVVSARHPRPPRRPTRDARLDRWFPRSGARAARASRTTPARRSRLRRADTPEVRSSLGSNPTFHRGFRSLRHLRLRYHCPWPARLSRPRCRPPETRRLANLHESHPETR